MIATPVATSHLRDAESVARTVVYAAAVVLLAIVLPAATRRSTAGAVRDQLAQRTRLAGAALELVEHSDELTATGASDLWSARIGDAVQSLGAAERRRARRIGVLGGLAALAAPSVAAAVVLVDEGVAVAGQPAGQAASRRLARADHDAAEFAAVIRQVRAHRDMPVPARIGPAGHGRKDDIAELSQFAMQVGEETSRPITVYLAVTVLYIITAFFVNRVLGFIEKRTRVPGLIAASRTPGGR